MDTAECSQYYALCKRKGVKIMDGAFKAFVRRHGICVVEDFARKHREDCQLRLARIANNAEPEYRNGHPKAAEKGAK